MCISVRPLVWAFDQHTAIWWADSVAGRFNVWEVAGYDHCFFRREGRSPEEAGTTIECAKAAAQADYEARIRSALVPATSVAEPSEATERTLDERMKKGTSDFAAILNADQGYIEGVKAAAKKVAKRRDGYVEEHGSYDPDTGATEFPGTGEEYVGELDEIEEEILALLSAPVAKNG